LLIISVIVFHIYCVLLINFQFPPSPKVTVIIAHFEPYKVSRLWFLFKIKEIKPCQMVFRV
jgi:hypothetical protein